MLSADPRRGALSSLSRSVLRALRRVSALGGREKWLTGAPAVSRTLGPYMLNSAGYVLNNSEFNPLGAGRPPRRSGSIKRACGVISCAPIADRWRFGGSVLARQCEWAGGSASGYSCIWCEDRLPTNSKPMRPCCVHAPGPGSTDRGCSKPRRPLQRLPGARVGLPRAASNHRLSSGPEGLINLK